MVFRDKFCDTVVAKRIICDDLFADNINIDENPINKAVVLGSITTDGKINFDELISTTTQVAINMGDAYIMLNSILTFISIDVEKVIFTRHSGEFDVNVYIDNVFYASENFKGPGTPTPNYGFKKIRFVINSPTNKRISVYIQNSVFLQEVMINVSVN